MGKRDLLYAGKYGNSLRYSMESSNLIFQELSTVGITEEDADLDIPMFIAEHDMSLHGIRYYNP